LLTFFVLRRLSEGGYGFASVPDFKGAAPRFQPSGSSPLLNSVYHTTNVKTDCYNDLNMNGIKVILLINFLILQLIWLITSSLSFRDYLNNLKKIRTFFIWSLGLLLYLQIFTIINSTYLPAVRLTYLSIGGLLINISGLILCVWAKLTMKVNWGPPAQHDVKKQKKLVTFGPFSYTRNPIYLGLMLFFAGIEISLSSYLVLLVIPLFTLIKKAVLIEEILLEKYFGNEYLAYKKRVPRFF